MLFRSSPDGLTYSFDLVKTNWQDGKPFTSEDVKYSLIEVSGKFAPIFSSSAKLIDRIETPAPDKVVISLKRAFGPFLMSLACAQGGAIMPAHLYRGTDPLRNATTTTSPVGTGAFKLSEWRHGNRLRFVRNPDYWEPNKPYLDEIVCQIMTDGAARTHALQAGEVDYIPGYYFAASDLPMVRANQQLREEISGSAPSVNILFFNTKRKPLDDKRVRQALFMAIDRDYLLKNAYRVGDVGAAPFTSRFKWAANPEIDYKKMYPFNAAKANALLDEAGVKRGSDGKRFTVRLGYAIDNPTREQAAVAIKSMWRDVGVDVTIDAMERAIQMKRIFEDRDFDTTLQGYTSYGDPALGIAIMFTSQSIGKAFGNPANYANPAVDALFEKGESASTQEDRGKFYKEVQTILADDLPVLTLQENLAIDVSTKRLKGVWGGMGYGLWNNAWMTK